jgi:hypothetical protein
MSFKVTLIPYLFNPVDSTTPQMADLQTSYVDAKLAPVNVGPWNFVFW